MTPSDSETTQEVASISPDAMARILEPRVRSNAKNNSKVVKTGAVKSAPKPAPAKDDAASEIPTIVAPIPGEATEISEIAPDKTSNSKSNEVSGDEISRNLGELRELILSLQETQESRDHAFDLLYEELNGYKNDFYLERLKPTLRALLFLLDSIEGFERELLDYEGRGDGVLIKLVKANLVHFREQLVDVLTLSELAPIEQDGDTFDPKTQRAIEVVKVEPDQNNTVQRQIRGGWKLGGKMLRPADVVVGRSG